jgi:DNA-binding NarL/FixJ family response regulator
MSRIYLADDHALLRDGLRALLELAGHAVVGGAADPAEALADIVRLQPEIVLLDLQLDGRSGLELLDELRLRAVPARVIILSMSNATGTVAEALRLGAAGYLLKGSAGRELMAAVEAVSAGRRYLCPAVSDAALQGLAPAGSEGGESLSPRERQILVRVARGKSSAAIGEELHLSSKTVDTYRSRLMAKLRLGDLPALVRWAIREGLVGLDE